MLVSPFTFYRGAALIMAADLAGTPSSGLMTQLCGDAHLSNFGGYASAERRLVFDINDFDETFPGPFEWDVKRLAASFVVAGRDNGFTAKQSRKITLAAVDAHANSIQDDARTFASLHAGFAPEGKDDDYYSDIGNFDDVYAYNEQVLRDRDAANLYDPASADYWKWDAASNREVYRGQRVEADGMFNNTRFVVAALLANRVLSAINAARIVVAGNKAAAGEEIGLGAVILGDAARAHGLALTLTHRF